MISCRRRIILTVLFAASSTTAQAQTEALRLALACSQASELMFRFTLENVGSEPTAVVIGSILGNDKKYLPNGLQFTLRRSGVPDTEFDWFDPSVPGVAGRIDPWLVPLPVDASYSVAVSIPKGLQYLFSTPADIRVRLTTQGVGKPNLDLQGLQLIHVWVGALTSDWIPFPRDCHPQ